MREVILHCSDSSWGNAATIALWHKERGFREIGYNYIVCNGWTAQGYFDRDFDGAIESGRNPEQEGAHCKGRNHAIGVCLIGRSKLFTDKQIDSVKILLLKLKEKYEIIKVYQHSDFDVDKFFCAGLDLKQFRDIIEGG